MTSAVTAVHAIPAGLWRGWDRMASTWVAPGCGLLVQTGKVAVAAGFAGHTVRPLAATPADGGIDLIAFVGDGNPPTGVADRIVAAAGPTMPSPPSCD